MKRLLLIASLLTSAAFASDEFNSVVNAVESTYRIHHKHIPMMGVMLKFTPNHESRSIKIAIFDDVEIPAQANTADLQHVVAAQLGPEWTPYLRIWSRNEGESLVIFAKPNAKSVRLLITTLERGESVIMSVDVNDASLRQWMNEPENMIHRSMHEADEN